jgi:Cellulase (glycosyl hydrolase family 5)
MVRLRAAVVLAAPVLAVLLLAFVFRVGVFERESREREARPIRVSRTSVGLPCCGISYPIWNPQRDRAFDFAEMSALGVGYVRLDLRYGNSEWQAEVDDVVTAALARGIEPVMILGGWLRFDARMTTAEYEAFATEMAAKYRGKANVFEVINEPDVVGWTPETYVPYLQAAYRGVKAGNPDAIVSTGGIWKFNCEVSPCPPGTGMVAWTKGLYEHGAKGYFDAYALHLYDDPQERADWNVWDWAFVDTENVRGVLDAHGDRAKPIWSSENGARPESYTMERRAEVIRNQILAVKNQSFPVAASTHYTLQDDDLPGFGLLDASNARQPTWYAFRDAVSASG